MQRKPDQIAEDAVARPESERGAYLDGACAGDPELRRQVEALIAERLGDATEWDSPTIATSGAVAADGEGATSATAANAGEKPGSQIGRYKLLQMIGEGGFGSVYMAEQTEPVRRRVALKIIKLGMDTRQVIARFEAERQALALMDHPNIAKVLDAGATDTGRPYFVMELVRGVPLTEYCDTHNLSVKERVELFIDVCHALQHAHQKGIIHRDLKPSNVLVTLHDVKAVPKVIDFGIAKATDRSLTDKTLFTEFHQFIGTPQYMSPEQAEMSGLDVDTRSDVYSLGVILYELLAGVTPFESQTLLSGGYAGISQIIRDSEPPPLSTRFTGLGEERTSVAKHRRTEPERLQQTLRGELQWIIAKAMEKDRTRRYETANAFADDLNRYLKSEPIAAMPPSSVYRLRKFVRRNRALVLTGTLVTVALTVGLAVASLGWIQAREQLRRSEEMSRFLTDLHTGFDVQGRAGLGSADDLIERCRELFGDDHSAIGSLLFSRASILSTSGHRTEALRLLERCLEFQRESAGTQHESVAGTLASLSDLYAEAGKQEQSVATLREALRINEEVFGVESLQVAHNRFKLAQRLSEAGDPSQHDELRHCLESAREVFERELGPGDPQTVMALCHLGVWLDSSGKKKDAAPILDLALERGRPIRSSLGDLWFATLNAATIVAISSGNLELGKQRYGELIGLLVDRGMSGVSLVIQLLRYAEFLSSIKSFDDAEETLRQALEIALRDLPPGQEQRNLSYRSLVNFLSEHERAAEARPLIEKWVDEQRQAFGEESEELAAARERLDGWLKKHGFAEESADNNADEPGAVEPASAEDPEGG